MVVLNGILEESDDSITPIQRFYANTNIFITGGTGFLGRILVEKLLRSCPHLDTIYLLIRRKKGKEIGERLDDLFNDQIFNLLKAQMPNFRQKVKAIQGDSELPKLGISEEDEEILKKQINIVFHAAATVNFDEKLKKASYINIRGTRDLLDLCGRMERLQFVTHVSTAYAHCHRRVLEEKFYEAEYSSHQVLTLVDNLRDDTIDKITTTLLHEMPNTYAFTKSTSEDLIKERSDLPIAVFRPSIIVSTYKEPVPGWINNYYGPQGVSTAACLGLLRSLHCDENVNANIVPVDMCVNALIAVPWQCRPKFDAVQEKKKNSELGEEVKYDIPIYFYESKTYQPINWKEFRYYTHLYGQNYPSMQMIGYYCFHLRKSLFMHNLAIIFLHYFPALLFDFGLICSGKKPKLMKGYKKIHNFANVISYFSTNNWTFHSKNLANLCNSMDERDKSLFFCDLTKLDWDVFFQTYLLGCRTYLLKEDISTCGAALKRYNKIKFVTFVVLFVLAGLAGLFLKKLLDLFNLF